MKDLVGWMRDNLKRFLKITYNPGMNTQGKILRLGQKDKQENNSAYSHQKMMWWESASQSFEADP